MPSIGTIANEAKALLEDIKSNTNSTKISNAAIKTNTDVIKSDVAAINSNTAATDSHVQQLIAVNQAGFQSMSDAFQIQINLLIQNNRLLFENNNQNETIICWLNTIADLLCEIRRNTDSEVELQKKLNQSLNYLNAIFELVNASEAMAVKNNQELQEKIENCCPEKVIPEKPCFEPCRSIDRIDFEKVNTKYEGFKAQDKDKRKRTK